MKTTRKRYSADFKAKVAMEAIRGDLPPSRSTPNWTNFLRSGAVESGGAAAADIAAVQRSGLAPQNLPIVQVRWCRFEMCFSAHFQTGSKAE